MNLNISKYRNADCTTQEYINLAAVPESTLVPNLFRCNKQVEFSAATEAGLHNCTEVILMHKNASS